MTMNNLIIKYPLDLTGLRPENLVTNESHTAPRERARGFAPRYGAFFTKSMRIVHAATGKPLVKGVDYLALHLYEKATRATGQEICAAVQIINEDLDGEFLFTYQVVGGEFSANVSVIEELLAALALDNRPVKWGEILGLPNAFPPSAHLHDVDDLYGFEYLIEALDRIRSAILLGDYYDHEEIRQRIENLRNFLLEEDQKIIGMLDEHMQDHSNPHAVTKAQVGLGSVENFPVASLAEAQAGTANNRYMTPERTHDLVKEKALKPLTAHINDKANPHETTKAQVGLGLVENFGVASQAEAEAGSSNSLYTTVLRVMQMLTKFAVTPLSDHIADKSNPHGTTKAQVGLGSVDNYATASQAEAEAGTATNLFLTPFTGLKMIMKHAGELLTAHINDKANPHGTTKAQVGLGSVDDYPTATSAEMIAGTATNRFATPAGVKAVLNSDLGNYVPKADVNYSLGSAAGKIPFTSAGGVTQLGSTWRGGSVTVTMSGTTAVFNGNVDAVDCISRSDIRDKREVQKLSYERAVVILRESEGGHTYFLLDEDQRTGGVIAQYLLKNYPEALVETFNAAGEKRWGVRYNAISGLLMTLALGQENRIDSVESELKVMKEALKELLGR